MPPPITQMSDSWTAIGVSLRLSGCGTHGRHANRAIRVPPDARVVAEIVGGAAAEVVRHQVGDNVLAVRTAGKIANVGGLERGIEKLAADIDRQRAESPAARLRRLLQRSQLICVRGPR